MQFRTCLHPGSNCTVSKHCIITLTVYPSRDSTAKNIDFFINQRPITHVNNNPSEASIACLINTEAIIHQYMKCRLMTENSYNAYMVQNIDLHKLCNATYYVAYRQQAFSCYNTNMYQSQLTSSQSTGLNRSHPLSPRIGMIVYNFIYNIKAYLGHHGHCDT